MRTEPTVGRGRYTKHPCDLCMNIAPSGDVQRTIVYKNRDARFGDVCACSFGTVGCIVNNVTTRRALDHDQAIQHGASSCSDARPKDIPLPSLHKDTLITKNRDVLWRSQEVEKIEKIKNR